MNDIAVLSKVNDKGVSAALQEMESMRMPLKRNSILTVVFVVAGVCIMILMAVLKSHPQILAIPVLTCWGIAAWLYRIFMEKKKDYVALFKRRVIQSILYALNPELSYFPESKIPVADYDESNLYTEGFDIYRGEDYAEGIIGPTRFGFSELNVYRKRRPTAESDVVEVFHGLFFSAHFTKYFRGRTYVWSHANPGFTSMNQEIYDFAVGLEKVILDDPEFMNQFVVYSDNEAETRTILTASFMQRMMKMVSTFGYEISFSMLGSKFYFAIPIKKDLFEPAVLRKPDAGDIIWYYNLLLALAGVVEELNASR